MDDGHNGNAIYGYKDYQEVISIFLRDFWFVLTHPELSGLYLDVRVLKAQNLVLLVIYGEAHALEQENINSNFSQTQNLNSISDMDSNIWITSTLS